MPTKRIYKSKYDRKIAGVCGGLAEYLDTDPVVIRLIFVALIFAGGLGLLAYLIGWIIIPERRYFRDDSQDFQDQHGNYRSQNYDNKENRRSV